MTLFFWRGGKEDDDTAFILFATLSSFCLVDKGKRQDFDEKKHEKLKEGGWVGGWVGGEPTTTTSNKTERPNNQRRTY